jgi:hypothetical protein
LPEPALLHWEPLESIVKIEAGLESRILSTLRHFRHANFIAEATGYLLSLEASALEK